MSRVAVTVARAAAVVLAVSVVSWLPSRSGTGVSAASSTPQSTTVSPNSGRKTMYHEPTTQKEWGVCPRTLSNSVRGTRLAVPKYKNRPTVIQTSANPDGPLVVMLHGMRGCIEKLQKQTDIEELAPSWGVNLLWLSGAPLPQRSWNTNNRCCGESGVRRVDDFAYIDAALKAARAAGLRPSKYVVVGKSNGAGMAVSVGCHFHKVFSVVVSVAGFAGVSCARANLSLIAMGGTADQSLGDKQAEVIANLWRSRVVKCASTPLEERRNVARVRTWSCGSMTYVRLVQMKGVGHIWPTWSFYHADEEVLKAALGEPF
jgi:poly(3-hydroxybutyrate) depolymerase